MPRLHIFYQAALDGAKNENLCTTHFAVVAVCHPIFKDKDADTVRETRKQVFLLQLSLNSRVNALFEVPSNTI